MPAYKQFHFDTTPDTTAVRLSWGVSAAGQGGFGGFGGGGQAAPLDLALRRGQPIQVDSEQGVTFTYDDRIQPELSGGSQEIVLAGDCLPENGGRVHTLFLNTGAAQMQIPSMDIEILSDVPSGAVHRCGEERAEPEPEPDAMADGGMGM